MHINLTTYKEQLLIKTILLGSLELTLYTSLTVLWSIDSARKNFSKQYIISSKMKPEMSIETRSLFRAKQNNSMFIKDLSRVTGSK